MNTIELGGRTFIELAQQAGFVLDEADCIRAPKTLRVGFELELEHFANLVAEHEREACAKIADAWDKENELSNYGAFIALQIRARGTT